MPIMKLAPPVISTYDADLCTGSFSIEITIRFGFIVDVTMQFL